MLDLRVSMTIDTRTLRSRPIRPLILGALLTIGAACGDSPSGPEPVASVTLSASVGTVVPAQTLLLIATLKDGTGNVLSGRTVVWASSDQTRARVDGNGLVTGVAQGNAQI